MLATWGCSPFSTAGWWSPSSTGGGPELVRREFRLAKVRRPKADLEAEAAERAAARTAERTKRRGGSDDDAPGAGRRGRSPGAEGAAGSHRLRDPDHAQLRGEARTIRTYPVASSTRRWSRRGGATCRRPLELVQLPGHSKPMPEPTTRSLTVRETRTSPDAACASTRAAMYGHARDVVPAPFDRAVRSPRRGGPPGTPGPTRLARGSASTPSWRLEG
jgi:hypothetical protein